MGRERERRLEEVLVQISKLSKGIPFGEVIKVLYGTSVEKFDAGTIKNKEILAILVEAMRAVCKSVQAKPIERPRPNEVGNDMEPIVIKALVDRQLRAAAPRTKSGKGKSAGYPDVRIETDGIPIFLEVKTYAAGKPASSFRTFYLSPAKNAKVTEDGYHLLVAFEIEREGNFYTPIGFNLVDLFGLDCDLKAEFNSNNKRLYGTDRILAQEAVLVPVNTFPLPPATANLSKLDPLAQAILTARAAHPGATLADLYDPDLMPPDLRRAHSDLDRAVDRLYRPAGIGRSGLVLAGLALVAGLGKGAGAGDEVGCVQDGRA